jgi:hypothetical protein
MRYANGLKTGRLYKYEKEAIAATQDAIVNSLPDICKKQSRGRSAQYEIDRQREPLTGFCYLGAQAVWVLLANLKGWKDKQGNPKYLPAVIPRQYLDGEDTHWFVVRVKDGTIIDPTAAQFTKRIPYEHARLGAGMMASHLREKTGTAQLWQEEGIFTPDRKTAALLDVITKKDNPSWKQKKPTTDFSRLKRNQKVIMYHATSLTDAIKMINGFDTNRLVRSKYHPQGYSYRGLYVAPVPIRSFGYVVFKLALRTNNLHGTSWSANIGRPSDPTYDAESAAYNQKRSEQMYPNSFRPYLSYTLLRPTEPQALYRGIVSPDMILGVEVGRNGVWLTREEFMQEYDVEEFFEGFDPNSPNYTVDEYLDYIGGGKRDRQRVIDTIHRMMRYDRDPERRNDNVDRLMNQLDFGVSAQRSFLRKFKQKYGDGSQRNPRRRRNGTRLVPKEQVRMVGFSPEKTAEVEPTIPYILETVEYIANEGELLFPSPIRPMTKAEFSDGRSVVDVGHPNGAGHGQYDTIAVEVAINPNMEPFDIAANVFHENLHHACPEMTEVQVRDLTGEAMLFLFGEYNLGKPYAEGRLKANPRGKKKVTRDSKGRKIPDRYLSGFTGKARKERIAEIEQRRDEYAKAIDKYGDEDKIPQKIKRKLYRPFATDQGIVSKSSSYTKEAHRRGFEGDIAEKAQAASKYYGGKIPKKILDTVMDRGMAAWASGGHRPGQTPQSWGYARVNSFLVGGKTFWTADADLTKKLPKSVALAIADQSVFSPSLSVLWSD